MILDTVLTTLGLLGLTTASIIDLKTREVPDTLTHGLLLTGLALRTIGALTTKTPAYLLTALGILAATILLGNIIYHAKQWGGGDAKLLMSISVLFATKPSFTPSSPTHTIISSFFHADLFILIILINILITGAVYGLVYSATLAIRNKKKFTQEFLRLNHTHQKRRTKTIILITTLILLIPVNLLINDTTLKLTTNFLLLFLLTTPYLYTFTKAVETTSLYQTIPLTKLTPGDWVEHNITKNGTLLYKKKRLGIEPDDIQRLHQAKIKTVTVKYGIPFVPPFLLGTAYTLLFNTILLFPTAFA